MIIPEGERELCNFLSYVIRHCMASSMDRRKMYEKRFRYYMFGQNSQEKVRFNRLKSHIHLIGSFLYSSDSVAYDVAAPPNADPETISRFQSAEDEWNEVFRDSGLADVFADALDWSIVYDSMIIKSGWNDEMSSNFGHIIDPGSFGVFHEETSDFASQPAICHSYMLDYDDAVERLIRAGLRDKLPSLVTASAADSDHGLPAVLTNLMITSSTGTNVQNNITGTINPNYEPSPLFQARVDREVVRWYETWIWDTNAADYRIFHSTDPDILVSDSRKTIDAIKQSGSEKIKVKYASDTNFFLPKENPFTVITPYRLYNYFFGDCHLEDLIPLQNWSNERLVQIDEILQKQTDPAKVFSGFMGLEDEKAGALGGAGTWVADSMPGAKVEELKPEMPGDLFAEFNEIGGLFMEQSGLTQSVAGKGDKNVRSHGQLKELQITGGGRVRRTAIGIEKSLVRLGDIGLRLYAKNCDERLVDKTGGEFTVSQIIDQKWSMTVAGHSHSPLFTSETKGLAATLLKARAIDQERFIRLMRPPGMGNMIHELRDRTKAQLAAAQNAPPGGKKPAAKGKE